MKQKYRKSRQDVEELEEQLSTEQSLRSRGPSSNWNSPQKSRGAMYQRPGTGSSGFVSERGGGTLMDSFKLRDESVSLNHNAPSTLEIRAPKIETSFKVAAW